MIVRYTSLREGFLCSLIELVGPQLVTTGLYSISIIYREGFGYVRFG